MENRPQFLRAGDTVRIVSPASTPDQASVHRMAQILSDWGLKVELGRHVLARHGFLAGTDEERASDFNDAIRARHVRAIIAARGGKGSYRLVDMIDYTSLRHDPKFIVGFSDITALHFAVWKWANVVSLHGGLFANSDGTIDPATQASLRTMLMSGAFATVSARPHELTASLTTRGIAEGRLLGGNLSIMGTSAGWALPDLHGAILLIEAVDMGPGLIDRMLLQLRKGGHLQGVAGVAVGQFEKVNHSPPTSVITLVREHLEELDVPVLGGLPIGHGRAPLTVPLGLNVRLDADRRCLEIEA